MKPRKPAMKPTELKQRLKAYQHANEVDSFGGALTLVAEKLQLHRASLYRYINGERIIHADLAEDIRALTPAPTVNDSTGNAEAGAKSRKLQGPPPLRLRASAPPASGRIPSSRQ